jgi:aspartyl-tRNA(Asn)/glutamyl-tRNA(Gln) amidotransferase subunit A
VLPLDGVPLGIKDLFCTQGVETTAGSEILRGFVPPYESTVTSHLWRDGAVMLGKTNLDAFGMGSATTNTCFGDAINPWRATGEATGDDRPLTAGGSSGGSAAAVAGRLCAAATGTDTGGSIRQPASFTGIVGLKPTYGRCSRWGIVAFASSLDQAGPMVHTVTDAALLLASMAGFDPKDSTSVDRPVDDYVHAVASGVKGLKIGIPAEYRMDGMPADIEVLWQQGIGWLKDAGAEIVDISLPHTKYALPAYYIIAPAEASSNLARYDGVRYGARRDGEDLIEMYENTRGVGFNPEVRRRVMIGTYVLSAGYYDAYYVKALRVRRRISDDFAHAFGQHCDAVLTPTAPSAAFPLGQNADNPMAMYLNDVFTVPASLSGLPGISVPAGMSGNGLPLGLQVIGRPFDEATVLRVGRAIEQGRPALPTPGAS